MKTWEDQGLSMGIVLIFVFKFISVFKLKNKARLK